MFKAYDGEKNHSNTGSPANFRTNNDLGVLQRRRGTAGNIAQDSKKNQEIIFQSKIANQTTNIKRDKSPIIRSSNPGQLKSISRGKHGSLLPP